MLPQPPPHKFCVHCMRAVAKSGTCPHCGCDPKHYKPHPLYLKPYTLLQNQYVLGKSIGQGGFGITYIGVDLWLQKRVAIKEYMPSALATRDFIAATVLPIKQQEAAFNRGLMSFLHEARNLAKFLHPNIVQVHNFFEENHTGYMVMDYLAGQNLLELLMQSGGKLDLQRSLDIMLPILDALSAVHKQHIYHRDISPQNIFILTDNTPILIDFGAARHIVGENSRSLDLVLKHGYSPIEQYSGKGKIGAWTDIYACGALMYVMLSGILPPAATDRFHEDTLKSLTELADVPAHIANAINKTLNIKPEQRFQSIAAFKAALLGEAIPEIIPAPAKKNFTPILLILILFLSAYWTNISTEADKIETNLVSQAEKLLQQQEFIPAYNIYQTLKLSGHENVNVQQGLQQIQNFYNQTAQQYWNSQQIDLAKIYIQQGLELFPQQNYLLELQQAVALVEQQQEINQQIQQLSQAAQKHINQEDYPAAYLLYQQMLKLDNNLAEYALVKLEQIYITKIQDQTTNLSQRLNLARQGLNLFPRQAQLLAIEQDLKQKLQQQQQINTLLAAAQRQLTALQLTEPAENNAYLSYQRVLNLDPQHPQALHGLEQIANNYARLARAEKETAKALDLLQKGLTVIPNHAELNKLKQNLEQQLNTAKNSEENNLATINNLLNQAQKQVKQQQYELAHQSYNAILATQANNLAALQGLTELSQIYQQLAQQELAKQNLVQAELWLKQGLRLFPDNNILLNIRVRLELELAKLKNEPVPIPEVTEITEILTPDTVSESQKFIFTPSF
jgi:serine/threonine protein kinase